MKAVQLAEVGKVSVRDMASPRLRSPSDAIIRMTLAGICGSDLHIVDGRDAGCMPGTIMGHEFVGVIEEVGSAVAHLKKGDRVVAPFTVNCGACFYCNLGFTGRCERSLGFGFINENGVGLEGAQAELIRVPLADSSLVKLPRTFDDGAALEDEDALFLGDILSTAYGTVASANIRTGDVVAVVGLGPVGLLAVQCAKTFAPAHVIAIDLAEHRLGKAKDLGALTARPSDAAELCRQLTQGRGADAVIEAVGAAAALDLALTLIRPAATISIAGFHTEGVYALPITKGYNLNLTLKMGRCHARAQMDVLLPKVLQRAFAPRAIISHILPLAEAEGGYRMFRERSSGAIKVLLTP